MQFSEEVSAWFRSLQDSICVSLEAADGSGKFGSDAWSRPEGGGGVARVLEKGALLEKGGVMYSAVSGELPAFMKGEVKDKNATFYATGVSIVLHPHSPMCPIIHMNVRYFEMSDGQCWFGGGIDLTPHYVSREDAKTFHTGLKAVCDKHNPSYYVEFKKWADDYFFIPHRNETRGVGGIFFDRLTEAPGISKLQRWDFVKEVGQYLAPFYSDLLKKTASLKYGENEKQWQYLRRGRYVEFNLVYDKGTRFGLETNGRTESILVSMPPAASWRYDHTPERGTAEAETLSLLKKGISWI